VEELAQEMQSALQEGGQDITTQDELMSRVKEVVGGETGVRQTTLNPNP
jgi:hypothetical protein